MRQRKKRHEHRRRVLLVGLTHHAAIVAAVSGPPHAEDHRETVPAVDDIDHQREFPLLVLSEMSVERIMDGFIGVSLRKLRQRIRLC